MRIRMLICMRLIGSMGIYVCIDIRMMSTIVMVSGMCTVICMIICMVMRIFTFTHRITVMVVCITMRMPMIMCVGMLMLLVIDVRRVMVVCATCDGVGYNR